VAAIGIAAAMRWDQSLIYIFSLRFRLEFSVHFSFMSPKDCKFSMYTWIFCPPPLYVVCWLSHSFTSFKSPNYIIGCPVVSGVFSMLLTWLPYGSQGNHSKHLQYHIAAQGWTFSASLRHNVFSKIAEPNNN
jgi:hypothetical protein